jgi:hypothetical protein
MAASGSTSNYNNVTATWNINTCLHIFLVPLPVEVLPAPNQMISVTAPSTWHNEVKSESFFKY